jgi:hypothetical protein
MIDAADQPEQDNRSKAHAVCRATSRPAFAQAIN